MHFTTALAFILASIGFSTADAATKPSRIFTFSGKAPKITTTVFKIRRASWRDPLFGNQGWTHSSDWGRFHAVKGKVVKITLITKVVGLHPGVTVWYRGSNDTAPDNYIVDHFYPQNQDFSEIGAKDETTGKTIGNIAMKVITHAFDNDGHTQGYGTNDQGNTILKPPVGLRGIKDGKSGQLILRFIAPKTGNYQFVVGGYNPIKAFDGKDKHKVTTIVNIAQ